MKKIVYIATREPSYSRVSIVRRALHENFEVDEILSARSNYLIRLLFISVRVLWAWFTGRLRYSDAVFVGFFAQPIFPLIRLLHRGPIICDAYFSLYDTMVNDKRKAKHGSWLAKCCYWLDHNMLHKSTMCYTDTQQHVQYLKRRFDADTCDVRRLWISAENDSLDWSQEYRDASLPFEVFFWGGFIPLQGVETIVQAASNLDQHNVKFTIFGQGQTYQDCLHLKQKMGVSNLEFAGWKTPQDIQRRAAQSHLALGIFGDTEKAARVIPNKVYEALAMGIPLITRSSPAVDELLDDGKNVLTVPPVDPQQLARKILWVRDNYESACTIARRGQAVFTQFASPQKISLIIRDDLLDVLAGVPDSQSAIAGVDANLVAESHRGKQGV